VNKPSNYQEDTDAMAPLKAIPKTPSVNNETYSVSNDNVIIPSFGEKENDQHVALEREVSRVKHPRLHQRKINKILREQTAYTSSSDKTTRKRKSDSYTNRKNGDRLLYLVASLMGLAVMGFTRLFRPITTKITRWAKANPKTTQGIIAGIHLPLLAMGVMNGHNLYEMGYDTSNTMMYTFGAATSLGFLLAPFRRNRNIIALPSKVNMQRLAFTGLTVSSLMMSVGVGNRIHQDYPNTAVERKVHSIDQAVFSYVGNASSEKMQQERKAAGRMSAGGAVILTLLLVLLACAGICLIIGGVSGSFATAGASVFAAIGGAALLALSIWGIAGVSKKRKMTINSEKAQKE